MNNPEDKCAEQDGNKKKNLWRNNKYHTCRRKKGKMKPETSLVLGSIAYNFVNIENHVDKLLFESFLQNKQTCKNGSNATTSTIISKSLSINLKGVDTKFKIFLLHFLSNFNIDELNGKIKNSGILNSVENCSKQIKKQDSMNFVSQMDQNLLNPAKKQKRKKKKKKLNEEAIKCDNGPDLKESISIMVNNNSLVAPEKKVKAEVNEKSKKLKSEDGKCGSDNVQGSNNQCPHLLQKKKIFENGEDQKGSNSKSGKSKKVAKGKDSKRFVEQVLSNDELETLYTGVIRINRKNVAEAYIPPMDKGTDILVRRLIDRNRALEGDEVYYIIKDPLHHKLTRDQNHVQRTGVVVAIKKMNHNRTAVGTLKEPVKNTCHTTFLPRDIRIPKMHIPRNNWPPGFEENPQLFKNRLFLAKIKDWNDINFAVGEILKEVGEEGHIDSESSAIMLMYQLNEVPYSDVLIKSIPPDAATFSSPELKKREDLRTECVFTIDPATAQDLDDAVSCRLLPNGNYLIGVHIADVSYYLEDGSPLDSAASTRATTVYLVQKVYHMLPKELCELCSLTPGTDKLTFSVIFEMTPQAEVVQCDFKRSVINCCAQFSYEQVQEIIEKSKSASFPILFGPHRKKSVEEAVTILNTLAIKLRKKRFSNGALKIDQTKISFSLNEKGLPESYTAYVNKESHRLIEEFMLLANMAVAKRISQDFPTIAFLRSHAPPGQLLLKKVKEKLQKYNIDLDISSSKSLNASLIRYSGNDPASVSRMTVLNAILAKTLTRANYYCAKFIKDESDRRHYALNVELYTHFTSPIRRYADIVVHRLLSASLGYTNRPNWHPDNIKRIANNCNQKKYAAKLAGEASTVFFLTIYIAKMGPIVYEAVVCDIEKKSFDYIILDNGLQQRFHFHHLEMKPTVKNVDGKIQVIVHWPETEKEGKKEEVINIFSVIKIELKMSSTENKLESKLLRN